MRENLELTHGLLLSEHVMMVLAEKIGRGEAKRLVESAGQALRDDPRIREHLSPEQIDAALDPAGYLGSAQALIDRALASYERLRR
jgi:3-carboxy-cis,cis-muconate cycloisomerase